MNCSTLRENPRFVIQLPCEEFVYLFSFLLINACRTVNILVVLFHLSIYSPFISNLVKIYPLPNGISYAIQIKRLFVMKRDGLLSFTCDTFSYRWKWYTISRSNVSIVKAYVTKLHGVVHCLAMEFNGIPIWPGQKLVGSYGCVYQIYQVSRSIWRWSSTKREKAKANGINIDYALAFNTIEYSKVTFRCTGTHNT